MRQAGQGENGDSMEGGNRGTAEAFPNNDCRAADRGDQLLAQNPNSGSTLYRGR